MGRIKRLDGVRGLLAVYVMLGHAAPLTIAPAWLQSALSHGGAAVDLFFALSGLVIAVSLARYGGALRPFLAARARRLLPVYLLVLAGAILIAPWGDPLAGLPWAGPPARGIIAPALPTHLWAHIFVHVTLLHGLIPQSVLPYAYVTLLGPAWSLSTEWQFYLVIGLAAPRRPGRFALILLALGAAWHLLPHGDQFSRAFLPDAAPYFALGLASALWLRGERRLLLPCLLAACFLLLPGGAGKAVPPLIWGAVMLALARPFGALLEHRALLYLGAVSYPLYLVNEPVQRILALGLAPAAHGNAVLFSVLFLPASTGFSIAAAALLHHAVERPMMRPPRQACLPIAPPLRQ